MEYRTFSRTRTRAALLVIAGSLVTTGCRADRTGPDAGNADQAAAATARSMLAQMVARYQQASTYEDAGELYHEAVAGGVTQQPKPIPLSVTFARPNRIRTQMFDAVAVSDGKQIHAAAQQLSDQVLEVPAPPILTPANFPPDQVLRTAMTGGRPVYESPQIELLLAEDPLRSILDGAEDVALLDAQQTDGQLCARVLVRKTEGKRVYWIDQKDFTLRRVDLPAESLREEMEAQYDLTSLAVWIEMKGARLGGDLDAKAFQFEVPGEARRVVHFVTDVPGPKPQRIGETIGEFQFTSLDGQAMDRKALSEKIAVIDFWFTTCPPCRESMPVLEKLYQKYRDNPRVVVLAASVDDPGLAADKIEQTLRSWGATMPIVRDTMNYAASTFQIAGAPSTFLLGADGKIHGYKIGLQTNYDDIDAAIALLLEGADVAERILTEHDARVQDYEARLAAAADRQEYVEVPRVQIAPASAPQQLQLESLWQSTDVKKPGNILVVPTADGPARIFVIDGWRTVAELDPQGTVVGRHELSIPDQQAVTFMRTATDREGKRYFVASGLSQQQLHLFDSNWTLLWSFPDGEHAGIADVRLADLQGNGQLQLVVGYWDVVGVQGVSLEGKRLWSNRSLQNALQLAVTDADDEGRCHVLCINSRGTLVPIDYLGKQLPDIRVPDRAMIHLTAADIDGDGKVELCGLAADGIDKRVAVGIDATGSELWHYRLPDGVQQHQIEAIIPSRLSTGDGGWILPGPDGSVHLLTKDGQLADRFNHGAALTGLAVVPTKDKPILLLASVDGLVAWKATLPARP